MKNAKLVCCSLLISACIGFTGNSEARVTKEVAKAVLPFLMEAAGIPEDKDGNVPATKVSYKKEKVDAIIDMIYTDKGQQEMVEWATNNERPKGLAVFGKPFDNKENWNANSSNKKEEGEEELLLQKLFPCKTGTFTSFANHSSRIGYKILSATAQAESFVDWLNNGNALKKIKGTEFKGTNLDCKIARIIFILDIFDDIQQIKDICSKIPEQMQANLSISEYMCRPVSAIVANKQGDCVETLYRHLINIAIQDTEKLHIFHQERLPSAIHKILNIKDGLSVKAISLAGETSVLQHNQWKKALQSVANYKHNIYFDESLGTIYNIAIILHIIASYDEPSSFAIDASISDLENMISKAMNKLANSQGHSRFNVQISDSQNNWISKEIKISDNAIKRIITIGVCANLENEFFGHAEIISITPL